MNKKSWFIYGWMNKLFCAVVVNSVEEKNAFKATHSHWKLFIREIP